jgi:cytoskeletal protein CcmA (bactofilin family)
MPAKQQEKVAVPCPHCGHSQTVPRTAVTTVCKECGGHFHVQEVLKPKARKATAAPERKRIVCFDCATELAVPLAAESTMCKRCSAHIDLRDYHIANAVSRNFRTKGIFVVEPKGYVFNTEALVGDAVIKGRFLGKLKAEGSLTIHSSAEIKGSFTAGQLIIPVKNRFYWKEPVTVGAAEIAGEIAADLIAAETVVLKSTGVLFGNIQARNLIVEPGAVLVGTMRVGEPAEKPAVIGPTAELSE